MEREKAAVASVIIILAAVSAVVTFSQTQASGAEATFFVDGEKVATVTLEVADTEEERRKGLMNRRSLEKDHGMLFVFPDKRVRTFWMKNTYVPLDMIFIAENSTIVDIQQADPEPNTPEEELQRYTSSDPAKYVIEVNQGFSERKNIEIGDEVSLTPIE